jgi:radical SAM/Cys-rich protein
MSRETARQCLEALVRNAVPRLDLTGGAPELNPSFRFLVDGAVEAGASVMVRTNLTVLLEDACEGLPEYLAERGVHVIASMPCYTEENVDAQRGQGVYRKSVRALTQLNAAGYGVPGGSLRLSLVYNPGGPFLPGPQAALESDYRRELRERHGVEFTDLFTIANMPIGRFRESLKRSGELESYTTLLSRSYNPEAAAAVMCRRTVSVGWDGRLYDCDFNQMLDLQCGHGVPAHIKDFDVSALATRQIVVGPHCFGCTAGAGSSCGGALV